MITKFRKISVFGGLILAIAVVLIGANNTFAQLKPGGDFGLEVSPSPLVETIKPGVPKTVELKIRNTGTGTEKLTIIPRKFDIDKTTGKVTLGTKVPEEINDWITFSSPTFTVEPGKVFTQNITFDLPKQTGFSYSFALVISRTDQSPQIKSGATLQGSVAVFTLVNVDRPGATRKFDITEFKPTQSVYEYLPAEFNITFQNTGNTIIRPVGNVFIQGSGDTKAPIASLPVNPGEGYLIPGSPRTLTTEWNDGFPLYEKVTKSDGKTFRELKWDWSRLQKVRFGQYTAKLVAVYNDGKRDVPVERTVSFWVIPWRVILGAILVLAVFVAGLWFIFSKSGKLLRRGKKRRKKE